MFFFFEKWPKCDQISKINTQKERFFSQIELIWFNKNIEDLELKVAKFSSCLDYFVIIFPKKYSFFITLWLHKFSPKGAISIWPLSRLFSWLQPNALAGFDPTPHGSWDRIPSGYRYIRWVVFFREKMFNVISDAHRGRCRNCSEDAKIGSLLICYLASKSFSSCVCPESVFPASHYATPIC
jgi:hypothetical protein